MSEGLFAYLDEVEELLVDEVGGLNVGRWDDARAQNAAPPRVVFIPNPEGRTDTFGPPRQTLPVAKAGGRSVSMRNVPLQVRIWGVSLKVDEEVLDDDQATEWLASVVIARMRELAVGALTFERGAFAQPTKGQRGRLYVLETVLDLPVLERRTRRVRVAELEVHTTLGGTDAPTLTLPLTPESSP